MSKALVELNGFDELIKKIEKAGGSIDKIAQDCVKESASTMEAELKKQMQKSGVDGGLISRMDQTEISKSGNQYSAHVGYRKGSYNPDNPSDGYKVVFLNYGTPNRRKHGKVSARGFIQRAKNAARKTIKKQQEQSLHEILKELEK